MLRDLGPRPAGPIMSGWGLPGPCSDLRRFGQILHVWSCKAHDCASHNADLFIDLTTNQIQACWEDNGTPYWIAPGAPPRPLGPNGDCSESNKIGVPGLLAKYGTPAAMASRIAFSDKLGIQIFARGGPAWCAAQVQLDIVIANDADFKNREFFKKPEFDALVRRLGSKVLAKTCPAAREATIRAVRGDLEEVKWLGVASAAQGWAPQPHQAGSPPATAPAEANANKPPPVVAAGEPPAKIAARDPSAAPPPSSPPPTPATTEAQAAPPAQPAATATTSPLLGDWAGSFNCGGSGRQIVLGVYEVADGHMRGIVDIAPAPQSRQIAHERYYVDGPFDRISGQFQFKPGDVLQQGYEQWERYIGTEDALDAAAGTVRVNSACNKEPMRLTRVATPSKLAARVAADAERRRAWIAEAAGRPHPDRLVGAQPAGTLRRPSCEELLAWAAATPLTSRVRVAELRDQGMLRHYDDANSSRVFGSPAYYWTTVDDRWWQPVQTIDVRQLVSDCGAKSKDPRFSTLVSVVNDRDSLTELGTRHRVDTIADETPATTATTGGSTEEEFANLAPLTEADKIAGFFGPGQVASSLSKENIADIVAEAKRLRGLLAKRAEDEARASLAALPESDAGISGTQDIVARYQKAFGTTGLDDLHAAANKRRDGIETAMLDAALAAIEAAPRTLDGVKSVRDKATQAKAAIHDLPDGAARIEAAVEKFDTAAIPDILVAERDAMRQIPATPDGARTLSQRRARVDAAVGLKTGAGAEYGRAVDARLAEIGHAVTPDLQAKLAAVPLDAQNRGRARQIATEAAAPFGASPTGQELRALGEAREAALLDKMVDGEIAKLDDEPINSVPALLKLYQEAVQTARSLSSDPAGKAAVARWETAAQQRLRAAAAAYLPRYKSAVEQLPASPATALHLATAAVVLGGASVPIPELKPYRDLTRAAALRAQSSGCRTAGQSLGISAKQGAMPAVVGDRTATLDSFACGLNDVGINRGQFDGPADPGATADYALTFFVSRAAGERASANMLQAMTGLALGNPTKPRGVANDVPKMDDIFNFSLPPDAKPSPTADSGPFAVRKIVFRRLIVGPGETALVGVEVGDGAKMEATSIDDWRRLSASMVAANASETPTPAVCAAAGKQPATLSLMVAARALLKCPPPK